MSSARIIETPHLGGEPMLLVNYQRMGEDPSEREQPGISPPDNQEWLEYRLDRIESQLVRIIILIQTSKPRWWEFLMFWRSF